MKPYVQWGAAAIALASVLGVGAAMSVAQDKEAIVKERQAAMKQATWQDHAISLAYGLDFALVILLSAMWSFHYRTLRKD